MPIVVLFILLAGVILSGMWALGTGVRPTGGLSFKDAVFLTAVGVFLVMSMRTMFRKMPRGIEHRLGDDDDGGTGRNGGSKGNERDGPAPDRRRDPGDPQPGNDRTRG